MKVELNFFSDDGHGWLKVPTEMLHDLGIADDISQYSYRKGDFCFLEEDCDASLFLRKMKDAGMEVRVLEHTHLGRSPIRNYVPYKLIAPKFIGEKI